MTTRRVWWKADLARAARATDPTTRSGFVGWSSRGGAARRRRVADSVGRVRIDEVGGVQANSYSFASAQRTESVRASNRANQQTVIDVDSFTSWVSAVAAEQRARVDDGLAPDGTYEPVAGTESAFLFQRFRPEFPRRRRRLV